MGIDSESTLITCALMTLRRWQRRLPMLTCFSYIRGCVAFCDFIATRHSQYAPVQWAWLAEAGTTSSEKL